MADSRRIILYDHNKTAYEKVEAMLEEDGKAAVIHPTGTGKSYIAFALIEAHPLSHFVWIAPSAYIYALQTDKLWQSQHISFENVEFHTYAWLMHNEEFFDRMNPDYIILDEFHRAGAAEWGRSIQNFVGMYPKAKLLGMSATNVRYLDNQRDMADELFEGAVASEMGLCEAMARQILPEPKYVISVYSYEEKLRDYESQITKLKNKRQKTRAELLMEKLRRALQQADGLDAVFAKHVPAKDAKIIVFCSNAGHMQEITEKAPDWFGSIDREPHIYSVYTYNPDSEADFRRFVEDGSGHLKLLFCIDMLNEGIHVDDVDAVVLCRPTVSPIVYKQQIGRALAAGSTKRPVVFDMVNNFDNLYQIDALKEEFDELVQMYGRDGDGGAYDFGGFEVVDELRDCRELLEQIQRNLDTTWDIYYQELCRYGKKNGTVRVPRRHVTEDGLYLGRWMQRQRALYQEGRLSGTKAEMLEALGIVWETESDQRFGHWIGLLKEYGAEHGDLMVPSHYETEYGEKLGNWCFNIRSRYKKGKVPEERACILDGMGFVWETFDAYWQEGYSHALAYFEENGNIDMPKRYRCADGYRLGLWISTQRNVRLGRVSGNLNEEKIRKLDALGMAWADKGATSFEKHLASLKKYMDSHGDDMVPDSYVDEDGVKLGKWVTRIRWEHANGKLSDRKRRMLEAAGFAFHGYNNQWHAQYLEAKSFCDTNGDLHVPAAYTREHGGTLAQWINSQRREYRKEGHGSLSEDQVELLEAIHIEEGSRAEKSFEKGVEEFRRYVEEYHDNLVPSEYATPEGYRLGRWLCHQREKYGRGQLSEAQVRALEDAGMVWESTETVRAVRHWNVMYETAKQYASEHGGLGRVPYDYETPDGRKLGSWVVQQRRIRKGTVKHSINLDEEKIGMLDAIGMNWGRNSV